MRIYYILIVLFFSVLRLFSSDTLVNYNKIYKETIKSVRLFRTGFISSEAEFELNSKSTLTLLFDDLSANEIEYNYTIVHYDRHWNKSNIDAYDYIEGYTENNIEDYSLSTNAIIKYTHYSLEFPNQDIKPKISGNYLLIVYQDNDLSKKVLSIRFRVYESISDIDFEVKRSIIPSESSSSHDVNIKVNTQNLKIFNPAEELFPCVKQNGREDNLLFVSGIESLYGNQIIFKQGNFFKAGNEYRNFDSRTVKYLTEKVADYKYLFAQHHLKLFDTESRIYKNYYTEEDINGRYVVRSENSYNPDLESDYFNVYFTLLWNIPYYDKEVYVFGGLSNWVLDSSFKMLYNYTQKKYELTVLLKQGLYNYHYALVDKKSGEIDLNFFEGSHYETENDYRVYLYYRRTSDRYDRIIGYSLSNSQKKY